MIFILEALSYYEDTWNITFYYVVAVALLIGIGWTYYQVFIKGEKKKEKLKENVIYNHSNDIIEDYDFEPKKKKNLVPMNNYVIKDFELKEEKVKSDNDEDEYINEINKEIDLSFEKKQEEKNINIAVTNNKPKNNYNKANNKNSNKLKYYNYKKGNNNKNHNKSSKSKKNNN